MRRKGNVPRVHLRDFEGEYLPFKFKGFWQDGYCYLRVRVANGRAVFFCCQLPDYAGTSVTNAVEAIFERAVLMLQSATDKSGHVILSYDYGVPLLSELVFGKNRVARRRDEAILGYMLMNSIWVEHYPPNEGLSERGSYSQVTFTSAGEPVWNYAPIGRIEAELGMPGYFSVDYARLEKWKANAPT